MEDRKLKRKQVFISAEVELEGHKHKVIVRDVSEIGARISLRGDIYAKKGQKGVFRKDGLETPCEVMWTNEFEYGLRFAKETKIEANKPIAEFVPDKPYNLRISEDEAAIHSSGVTGFGKKRVPVL